MCEYDSTLNERTILVIVLVWRKITIYNSHTSMYVKQFNFYLFFLWRVCMIFFPSFVLSFVIALNVKNSRAVAQLLNQENTKIRLLYCEFEFECNHSIRKKIRTRLSIGHLHDMHLMRYQKLNRMHLLSLKATEPTEATATTASTKKSSKQR